MPCSTRSQWPTPHWSAACATSSDRRVHVNLFVGADNIRDLDGLATPVGPGEEVSIIPAISGG